MGPGLSLSLLCQVWSFSHSSGQGRTQGGRGREVRGGCWLSCGSCGATEVRIGLEGSCPDNPDGWLKNLVPPQLSLVPSRPGREGVCGGVDVKAL